MPFGEKKSENEVAQSCPTLCDPMDCSLPGSSIHEIFQASVLEWVAISFSRGSFRPRDWTQVSCIAARHFTIWATREKGMATQFSILAWRGAWWAMGLQKRTWLSSTHVCILNTIGVYIPRWRLIATNLYTDFFLNFHVSWRLQHQ